MFAMSAPRFRLKIVDGKPVLEERHSNLARCREGIGAKESPVMAAYWHIPKQQTGDGGSATHTGPASTSGTENIAIR